MPINRPDLFKSYKKNMITFLNKYYDNTSTENFVKNIMKEKINIPIASIIEHKSYGNAEKVEVNLFDYIRQNNEVILSPSGSCYYNAEKKSSFIKMFIDDFLKRRKILKKEMLTAKEEGNTVLATIKNYGQDTVKRTTNSLIGATGNQYSLFTDRAGFNSVTSAGRHFIMLGYTHTERFLKGNFYFPDYESVLNHIVILMNVCPPKQDIENILNKYKLCTVLSTDLHDFLCYNLNKYTTKYNKYELLQYLDNLESHVINFIYYYNNLHNICHTNKEVMKKIFDNILNTNQINHTEDVDPLDLYKIDDDLIIIVAVHCAELIKNYKLNDLPKVAPDIAKHLIRIAKYMEKTMLPIMEILKIFSNVEIVIPNIMECKNMLRECVIVSDTDSVIFTTKDWIYWYLDKYNFSKTAFDIDSIVTFLLSKTLEWYLEVISKHRGCTGKDIHAIKMKNEFTYPVMITSIIPKHYVGFITMQEGVVLPKPAKDIKGLSFKSSSLHANTLSYVKEFLFDMIYDIYDEKDLNKIGDIDISKYISKIVLFEQLIIQSLEKGEMYFLNTLPIKAMNEYKKPEASVWVNYLFWEEVFSEKYGNIQIPNKCPMVPIKDKSLFNDEYLNSILTIDKNIYKKLKNYLNVNKDKKINRIPLNPLLVKTPQEIIPLIDTRSIAYKNASPLYLAMANLGFSIGAKADKCILYSDIYIGEGKYATDLSFKIEDIKIDEEYENEEEIRERLEREANIISQLKVAQNIYSDIDDEEDLNIVNIQEINNDEEVE